MCVRKNIYLLVLLVLSAFSIVTSCTPEPEVIVETIVSEVEVTREVEVTKEVLNEVEVTRLVEVIAEVVSEVEVTREVVVPVLVEIEVTRSDGSQSETTLDAVRERNYLVCGIAGGIVGFSYVEVDGSITGFDWDFCRALATAILGDPDAVVGYPTSVEDRFILLRAGEFDVLIRNNTWTLDRDTTLGINFGPVIFYDGQGIMVRRDSNIKDIEQLDGARICVSPFTTSEMNLADAFRSRDLSYEVVNGGQEVYIAGDCVGWTTDKSLLVTQATLFDDPENHIILSDTLSREPLAPAVRHGDDLWLDIVTWTVNCIILAEDLEVTSANVDEMLGSSNPEILNLLGVEGDYGINMNLSNDFCYQIIKQVGNYGEIYDRNLGSGSAVNLPRGLNSLWENGGLLYSPPFR